MNQAKHKKQIKTEISEEELDLTLEVLKKSIKGIPPKQQHILSDWIEDWSKYLSFEKSFDPRRLVYYKRGDIVLVHLGFNVGSELGGPHYAVVVEKDNNLSNSNVVVIPLCSLEPGKTPCDLHKSEVFLGNVIPGTGKNSYAVPLQIRPVSKLRIIKPKNKEHNKFKLNSDQMTLLDDKIKQLYTY